MLRLYADRCLFDVVCVFTVVAHTLGVYVCVYVNVCTPIARVVCTSSSAEAARSLRFLRTIMRLEQQQQHRSMLHCAMMVVYGDHGCFSCLVSFVTWRGKVYAVVQRKRTKHMVPQSWVYGPKMLLCHHKGERCEAKAVPCVQQRKSSI